MDVGGRGIEIIESLVNQSFQRIPSKLNNLKPLLLLYQMVYRTFLVVIVYVSKYDLNFFLTCRKHLFSPNV